MAQSRLAAISAATAVVTAISVGYHALLINTSARKRRRVREKLPNDLDTWRMPGTTHEAEEQMWQDLDQVFRDRGFTLWTHAFGSTIKRPAGTYQISSGFSYSTPSRGIAGVLGTVARQGRFDYTNPLTRIARTPDGHDVAVRVIVIRAEGEEHLKILRRIATGPHSLLSNNHTLPMLGEFQFEDIIFGLFPKAGGSLEQAYDSWPKNSVGDVIDMLMQALEGLAFLHNMNIAHRDAFHDNFLVQWHPESMRTMTVPVSCPRVYLIDFEVAVEYPPDCPAVSIGYPLGGSFLQPEMYARPLAPELTTGKPYSPFKLDIWQLGSSFANFKSTIAAIDNVLLALTEADPVSRIDAKIALERLGKVVHAMAPELFLLEPVLVVDHRASS